MSFFKNLFKGAISLVTSLFKTPKVPKPSTAPVDELADSKKKEANTRARLYATQGQAAGQELMSGQVSKRNTLFGN